MLLLVINCIIWPADAEGWECKCFVITLGLSFLFFSLSHSCHPATLEGRDHPSDYLIRLEPHWHLQAADRSVISGIRQETQRLTVVPLSLLCRDLEESQAASLCYPAGWTPQDSKVNILNVRWCRKHSQTDQTSTDCVAPTEEQWHCQSSDAFSWWKVMQFAENVLNVAVPIWFVMSPKNMSIDTDPSPFCLLGFVFHCKCKLQVVSSL